MDTAKKTNKTAAYIMLVSCMLIWGSLAIFVKNTSFASAQLVLCRVISGLFLLSAIFAATRKKPNMSALKRYGFRLAFSGIIMGFNWVCLFQSYRYTSVGVATLCYYTAPIIVLIGSAVFFKEKMTVKKAVAAVAAICGLILVTGASDGSVTSKGVMYGLASAALYAGVTLINKSVKELSGLEITIMQLIGAAAVMLPYALIKDGVPVITGGIKELLCVLILGFVHTGAALYMYFSAIRTLPVSAVAVMSYIDPASALVFAAVFLNEIPGINGIIGAVLIIGGAIINELPVFEKSRKKSTAE